MDFEEWLEGNYPVLGLDLLEKEGDRYIHKSTRDMYDAYLVGQQSKQAEIDTLRAKLTQLEKWAEFHIEDYNLSESDSEHDRGWFNAACQVSKLLKEVPNE